MVLGLLGHGRASDAARLAQHVVAVHHEAAAVTDNSYELFDCDSRQGEGCHNFAGLSSPVAYLHDALTRPGAVTVGMDSIITNVVTEDSTGAATVRAQIHNPVRPGLTGVWVVPPHGATGTVSIDGEHVTRTVGEALVFDYDFGTDAKTLTVS